MELAGWSPFLWPGPPGSPNAEHRDGGEAGTPAADDAGLRVCVSWHDLPAPAPEEEGAVLRRFTPLAGWIKPRGAAREGLAAIDEAAVVTPPSGMEAGYVPIAVLRRAGQPPGCEGEQSRHEVDTAV